MGMSVISTGFLAMLGGTSLLAWVLFRSALVRVHRRRTAVIVTALIATTLSLAFSADLANAHFQYLPRLADIAGQRTWPTATQYQSQKQPIVTGSTARLVGAKPAAGTHPKGAVVTINVRDAGVGFSSQHVLVYLPPQYFSAASARFPVVYLLHGSPGMPVDWLRGGGAARAGLAAARAGHPQILVMPRLSRHWTDDSECVDGARLLVETHLIRDVVPGIDAQLRTLPGRRHRTIAGMSAGGYCALNIGLRNRTVFGNIIDMSGFTHPTHTGGMPALFGHRRDLASLVAANSPDVYVDGLAAAPMTRLYLLCGTSDGDALRQMTAIRGRLTARGMQVTWATRPGGHTYGVWRPGLVAALAWAPG